MLKDKGGGSVYTTQILDGQKFYAYRLLASKLDDVDMLYVYWPDGRHAVLVQAERGRLRETFYRKIEEGADVWSMDAKLEDLMIELAAHVPIKTV